MNRPNFPGKSGPLPDIDHRLPSISVGDDGVLELDSSNQKSTALDDPDVKTLIASALEEVKSLKFEGSNVDPLLFRGLKRFEENLESDESNFDEIRLGLAISSLKSYSQPLLRDQYVSPNVEGPLTHILSLSDMLEERLTGWKRFQVTKSSVVVSDSESSSAKDLYSSVTDCLEEAADLVSTELVDEVKDLASLIENDPEMEKEIAFARVAVVNNLLVSLLQEVKSQKAKSNDWIGLLLARKIRSIAQDGLNFSVGKLLLGWVLTSRDAIRKIIGD